MKKYVLIHINKCAGGSIFLTFNQKDPEFGLRQIHTKRSFDRFKEFENPELKTFFFVRDPVSRIIGSFNFTLRHFRNVLTKRRFAHSYKIFYDGEIPDFNEVLDKAREVPWFMDVLIDHCNHIRAGASFYLNNSEGFLDSIKDQILFVGRVEHMKDDYPKLLDLLEDDSGHTFPESMDDLTTEVHRSKKQGKKLSQENIDFLREYAAEDYKVFQKLIDMGHLPQEYLDDMLKKSEYVY